MGDQGLSAPPSFLPTPGEPAILWKDWKKLFLTYILATGADQYGPVRKQAVLLHNLGVEGRRLYENLPELSLGVGNGEPSNVYEMTMKMLDLRFTTKVNVVLERHKFFCRMQKADEDIASYVAALRGLSLTCCFEGLADSLIRDQIVRCTNNKKVREKLLIKGPTLEEAIQIAKGLEHTDLWIREMENCSNSGKNPIEKKEHVEKGGGEGEFKQI